MGVSDTIVLLHGFTQTGASWAPVIAALGERYRALNLDLPGHGMAGERRPISFEDCVADLTALPPERFALCGYSLGGRVALRAALDLPDRIERLTLISASPGIADDTARAERREEDEALAAELESMSIEDFASRWAAQPLFEDQPPDVAATAHADRLRNDPSALATALRGLGSGTMEPLHDRLAELTIPVTLVAGERDTKYLTIAEEMAASIPRAELAVVPGAGHAAHLERPEEVAALL